MKIKLLSISIILVSIISLSSCTSPDDIPSPQNEYIELYQKTCTDFQSVFASTRADLLTVPRGTVTVAEVKRINNLQILTSYDQERLVQIEASEVYQRMKAEGDEFVAEAKERFLQKYTLPQYGKLRTFVEEYILEGTHNPLKLQQELEKVSDNGIKQCMTVCAALVDAYGEEHIWNESMKKSTLSSCDKTMIIRVSIVLLSIGADVVISTVNPITTAMAVCRTIDSICAMITIHNEWVDCTKRSKKNRYVEITNKLVNTNYDISIIL